MVRKGRVWKGWEGKVGKGRDRLGRVGEDNL
jgi:hypothetical protein